MSVYQFNYSKIAYGDIIELSSIKNDGFACMTKIAEMMKKAGVDVAEIPITEWADLQDRFYKGITEHLTPRGMSILNQVDE